MISLLRTTPLHIVDSYALTDCSMYPQPRLVSITNVAKTLKDRQEQAYRRCDPIRERTMISYTTYFKKFKQFWVEFDGRGDEPDELGFFYIDENGQPIPHHPRKWWEFGVIITKEKLEKFMPAIASVVRILFPRI